ncbi:MAG: CpaF family protein, partial [Deltaproteobacteria bacterium]|nr:CpaF family protein [Deltaproteobacteria bacterium]
IIVEDDEALLPDEMQMPDIPKEKSTVSARIRLKKEEAPDDLKIYQTTLYKVYKVAEQRVFKNLAPAVDEFTDDEWKRYSEGTMQVIEQLRRLGEIPITIDAYTLAQDILFEFTGLGPVEEMIADDTVKNIFVNSSDRIFVTRGFHKVPVKKCFSSEEALLKTIWRLLRASGYSGEKLPLTYRGKRGDVYFICMMPPLCSPEPALILEKARESKLTLDDFIHGGVLDVDMASYLQERIKERKNILVYGNRSSGRTTFLNAMFNYVHKNERVVMIERRLELLPAGENVVHISKGLNNENLSEAFSIIKNIIPDRIVIDDLDSNDIEVFLKLLLDGLDGIMATTFASSAEELINRFSIMLEISDFKLSQEVARKALLHRIDLLIGITRFPCGRHRVSEICEVASGSEGAREREIRKIFTFVPEGTDKDGKITGRFVKTGRI